MFLLSYSSSQIIASGFLIELLQAKLLENMLSCFEMKDEKLSRSLVLFAELFKDRLIEAWKMFERNANLTM